MANSHEHGEIFPLPVRSDFSALRPLRRTKRYLRQRLAVAHKRESMVSLAASSLNQLWRSHTGRRAPLPEGKCGK
eukprot:4702305-Amphidinium_carterae.1